MQELQVLKLTNCILCELRDHSVFVPPPKKRLNTAYIVIDNKQTFVLNL